MIVLIPVQSDAEGAKRAIFAAGLRSASHESIEPRAYSTGPKVTCEENSSKHSHPHWVLYVHATQRPPQD
jgi:hypothetical protein